MNRRRNGRILIVAGFGTAALLGIFGVHAAILVAFVTIGVGGIFLLGSAPPATGGGNGPSGSAGSGSGTALLVGSAALGAAVALGGHDSGGAGTEAGSDAGGGSDSGGDGGGSGGD